jgi:excisionase family DNA binding protein
MMLANQQLLLFEPISPYYELRIAAQRAGISYETARTWAERGTLIGAYRLGGRWRVMKRPFEEWLMSVQGTAPLAASSR